MSNKVAYQLFVLLKLFSCLMFLVVQCGSLQVMLGEHKQTDASVMKSSGLTFSVSDPFPPETPQNARAGNQTVRPDGTVSVLVLWEAPSESDLGVHHYKVIWIPRGTPPHSQSRAGRVTDGVSPPELSPLSHPSAGIFAQILCILLYLC